MPLTNEELSKFGEKLILLLPENGTPKGNKTLLDEFKRIIETEFHYPLSDDEYWDVRNQLISKGLLVKARGKGGSVRRKEIKQDSSKTPKQKKKENDLYLPFIDYINKLWAKDNGIKDYIVQNTANQGKKILGENGVGQMFHSSV